MGLRIIFLLACLLSLHLVACNSDGNPSSVAERKAQETAEKNPIKKGRYVCYFLSPSGDKIAPELFILSNNMYQVNDTTGYYKYHPKNSEIVWLSGPLYKPSENWVGFYTAKGTSTAGGGQALESMIEIESQKSTGGDWPKVMHCNCAEFE